MATKYRNKAVTTYNPVLSYVNGETKVKIKVDLMTLNLFISLIFTKSKAITKKNLMALRKLIDCFDKTLYLTNAPIMSRLEFIENALECILVKGSERRDVIIEHCRVENDPENAQIIEYVKTLQPLTLNEIHMVNKSIADRLAFTFILFYKEKINEVFMRIDQNKFTKLKEPVMLLKDLFSGAMNEIRKVEDTSASTVFSLRSEIFDNYIKQLVLKANDKDLIFKTGIQALNKMLSPGFAPGRLYLFLGLTGGFKSSMLLHCARWIKQFNDVQPRRKEPTVQPTVLIITTENSVEEEVTRLVNMTLGNTPVGDYDPDELIKLFRAKGKMTLRDRETDIQIMYYANNEIDTNDIYSIIEDTEDEGREVVALIVDYIKRIRPAEKAFDERIQLKNVSNELKTLATRLDIPVITANQINREGNRTVDEKQAEGKSDLARDIGRANIALSWDLLENVDWCALINMERMRSTNKLYLTVKRLKIRYKDLYEMTYFNHPFVGDSTIMLVDDNLPGFKSQSIESLASNIEGTNTKAGARGNKAYDKGYDIDNILTGHQLK